MLGLLPCGGNDNLALSVISFHSKLILCSSDPAMAVEFESPRTIHSLRVYYDDALYFRHRLELYIHLLLSLSRWRHCPFSLSVS